MSKPYGVISDMHFHNWSAFATTDSNGVNSRLNIAMNETRRAARMLREAGGDTLYLGGDTFHVRGSLNPLVLTPVLDLFENICHSGVTVRAIAGNHDLASKEAESLSNGAESLSKVGVTMITDRGGRVFYDDGVVMFPWHSSPKELFDSMMAMRLELSAKSDLDWDAIIHAPVNGVLIGIPDHGLEAKELAGIGFRRVLSGHYHAFKTMESERVISIGASQHQTWSDIATKAGFLLVYPEKVVFYDSHAPKFVEINDETDPDEVALIVDGNYVRVRGKSATDAEINEFRRDFEKLGAKGFSYQGVREVVSARTGGVSHKATSIESSVTEFVKARAFNPAEETFIAAAALDVLAAVRARTE